jgi:thiamine biosynthesis lipoprotein
VLSLALLLGGCERAPVHITGATQGTTYHVTLVDATDSDADTMKQQLEARLARIDASLSNYRDDSTLSRFNRAPVARWIELDEDLAAVLRYAQQLAADSDGAFDVTVAPLVELWGFGRQKTEIVPMAAQIDTARGSVDYRQLEVDPAQLRARKNRALTIDVNGIAQGYTVDRLADLLRVAGYRNYLVEVGGELRAAGHNARGAAWRIAIEQPDEAAAPSAVTLGNDAGITTAGDYHDYFERDGVRYSHTIDPRSGRPVAHKLASVTVIAPTAFVADGLDTVLEVLGPEAGFAYAEQRKIAACFMVRAGSGFTVRYTPAMRPYLATEQ